MKYYSLIILFISATVVPIHAQNSVGVGTTSPQGVLHIDAAKNTSGTTNAEDDVVVSTSGNVGVGTISPAEKLDVKGNILIQGNDSVSNEITPLLITKDLKYGSLLSSPVKAKLDIEASAPGAGLRLVNNTPVGGGGTDFIPVLGVDDYGNATWKDLLALTTIVKGSIAVDQRILQTSAATYYDITPTSGTISIPAEGLWLIYAKVMIGTYGPVDADATSPTVANRGAKQKDVFMHLRTSSNVNVASTMVYPETSGLHVGVLQLTHLYNAKTEGAAVMKLSVKSDHVASSSSTPTEYNNLGYTAFKTYGASTIFSWQDAATWSWTDPIFFAIRIDHTN